MLEKFKTENFHFGKVPIGLTLRQRRVQNQKYSFWKSSKPKIFILEKFKTKNIHFEKVQNEIFSFWKSSETKISIFVSIKTKIFSIIQKLLI